MQKQKRARVWAVELSTSTHLGGCKHGSIAGEKARFMFFCWTRDKSAHPRTSQVIFGIPKSPEFDTKDPARLTGIC